MRSERGAREGAEGAGPLQAALGCVRTTETRALSRRLACSLHPPHMREHRAEAAGQSVATPEAEHGAQHNMPWLSPANHVRTASHLPKAKGSSSCTASATLAASLFDAPSYACSTPLPLCLPLIAAS